MAQDGSLPSPDASNAAFAFPERFSHCANYFMANLWPTGWPPSSFEEFERGLRHQGTPFERREDRH